MVNSLELHILFYHTLRNVVLKTIFEKACMLADVKLRPYLRINVPVCCLFETDKGKMDQVLQETSNLRQMTNQIAYTNFRTGVDPRPFQSGPKVSFCSLSLYPKGGTPDFKGRG